MIDKLNDLLEQHGQARTAQRWVLPENRYRGELDYGGYIMDVVPADEYHPDCINGFAVVVKDDGVIEIGTYDDGNYPSLSTLTRQHADFLVALLGLVAETFSRAAE